MNRRSFTCHVHFFVTVQPLRHEGTKKEYEVCFCHELSKRELKYQIQVDIPITYDGMRFDEGLRLTDKRLGFLINFNVPLIKIGINRIIL